MIGKNADRPPAELSEERQHRSGPTCTDFEHGVFVGERRNEFAHVVRASPVVRHNRTNVGGRLGSASFAGFAVPPIKDSLHCSNSRVLVDSHQVDVASDGVFLDRSGVDLAVSLATQRGTLDADGDIAEVHHARDAIEGASGDNRDRRRPARQLCEAVVDIPAGPRVLNNRWRRKWIVAPSAVALSEDDKRPAIGLCEVDELGELALVAFALGAVEHGDVVRGRNYGESVDFAHAAHETVGWGVVVDVGGAPSEQSVFRERARSEQQVETPSGVPSAGEGFGSCVENLLARVFGQLPFPAVHERR